MITFSQKGDFKKTSNFFERLFRDTPSMSKLNEYGKRGVFALSAYTPVDTGLTASSWYYTIEKSNKGVSIIWSNSNLNKGVNIALILQYGHGTGTGGYVVGVDYINPALRSVFEGMADEAWKEMTKV